MDDLTRRLTDRAFLLTLVVMGLIVYGIKQHWPSDQIMLLVGAIAPFVLGEKYKDSQAGKTPDTVNVGSAGTVQTGSDPGLDGEGADSDVAG